MRLFNRQLKLSFVLLVVVVLLIFLHYVGVLRPVENFIASSLAPVNSRIYSLGTTVNDLYANSEITEEEFNNLEANYNQLLIENAQLRTLLDEREVLTDQELFLSDRGFESVSARVLGKQLQTENQLFIIDKGYDDGVGKDYAVIAGAGAIVAKIVEVSKHQSTMLLVNDSQSSLAAIIQTDELLQGVVSGDRGLSIQMDLIPKDAVVANGDIVVTSGLEVTIPRGLVIGAIERVESEPNTFFQLAFLRPLIDLNNLTIVSVVKPIGHE